MVGQDVLTIARRYLDAINRHDMDAVLASLAPGYVHHSGAGDLDVAAFRKAAEAYVAAFPDFRYELHDLQALADGQGVVARWTMRGTHRGRIFGSDPTGKAFASPGLSLHRFEDGLLVEDWEYGDDIAMFEDLGFHLEPPAG